MEGEGRPDDDQLAFLLLLPRLGGVTVGRRIDAGEEVLMMTGLREAIVRRVARQHCGDEKLIASGASFTRP